MLHMCITDLHVMIRCLQLMEIDICSQEKKNLVCVIDLLRRVINFIILDYSCV